MSVSHSECPLPPGDRAGPAQLGANGCEAAPLGALAHPSPSAMQSVWGGQDLSVVPALCQGWVGGSREEVVHEAP